MLKFIAVGVIASIGLMVAASNVDAGHGHHGCSCCGTPATVIVPAPAPMAQAPAPGQGYRTYSYQPAQPVYRSYSPSNRGRSGGRAYESAVNKSLGRGF